MPVMTEEKAISYNDMSFTLERGAKGWDISYRKGQTAGTLAAGLFAGASEEEARAKVRAVIRGAFPVGVKVVGPDVNHPARVGDLRLVPPDVTHPNFIHWDKESVLPSVS